MKKLYIIKIGGNIVDDETALTSFLQSFAQVDAVKILVHGGGKLATRVAEAMGIKQQMVAGRRITDAETLKVVTMVYAGYINKNIVAQLQGNRCNAMGITGADGNSIKAHQRINNSEASINYGYAGDIDLVNTRFLQQLLEQQITPVLAPITHNGNGQLLNTNADTIAQEIATAMCALYDTTLVYIFEKAGVLLNVEDEGSVISLLQPAYYQTLKNQQLIFAGMIPKLDNAFTALDKGVKKIIIGQAKNLNDLLNGQSGTTISNE